MTRPTDKPDTHPAGGSRGGRMTDGDVSLVFIVEVPHQRTSRCVCVSV